MQKECDKAAVSGECAEDYYTQASMGLAFIAYPSGYLTVHVVISPTLPY